MAGGTERILFVTGKLAESSLRQVLGELRERQAFELDVAVLGINVAALMHVKWLLQKLDVPPGITRVLLPGWCQGDLSLLEAKHGIPFERGPKDLRELPRYFDQQHQRQVDLSRYDIEIIAEINHAPLLERHELLAQARRYREQGADRIDYGCVAGTGSPATAEHIRLLVSEGYRVSIDSFDRQEVEQGVAAGADLVLSCNSTNVDWLSQVDAELVVVPDDFHDVASMNPVIDRLQASGRAIRLDPILEPIGFGFFRSLQRYARTRELWPEHPVLMGVGNVTELSEVDSAGVNFLLIAICQELNIHSVLTTQVINWACDSVREIAVCRRLIKYALDQRQIPKHLDSSLVRLRDPYLYAHTAEELSLLASRLKDPNFRIFAEQAGLHLMNRDGHWQGTDPFDLMRRALAASSIDPAHAFYLGYELARAETARQLGKQYVQDEPLRWGNLTMEKSSRADRHAFRECGLQGEGGNP